jgi:hypothetical protein
MTDITQIGEGSHGDQSQVSLDSLVIKEIVKLVIRTRHSPQLHCHTEIMTFTSEYLDEFELQSVKYFER